MALDMNTEIHRSGEKTFFLLVHEREGCTNAGIFVTDEKIMGLK